MPAVADFRQVESGRTAVVVASKMMFRMWIGIREAERGVLARAILLFRGHRMMWFISDGPDCS